MFRRLATLLKRNVETVCNFNIPRWQRCSPYKLLLRLTIDKGVVLGVLVSRWVFLCYQGLGHLAFQVGSLTESCVLRTHASHDVNLFCFRLGQSYHFVQVRRFRRFSMSAIPHWGETSQHVSGACQFGSQRLRAGNAILTPRWVRSISNFAPVSSKGVFVSVERVTHTGIVSNVFYSI